MLMLRYIGMAVAFDDVVLLKPRKLFPRCLWSVSGSADCGFRNKRLAHVIEAECCQTRWTTSQGVLEQTTSDGYYRRAFEGPPLRALG
jgi:hypothetical protein